MVGMPSLAPPAGPLPTAGYVAGGTALGAGLGMLVGHRLGHGRALGALVGGLLGAGAGYGTLQAVQRLLPRIDERRLLPVVWGLYGHLDEAGPADDPRVRAAAHARTHARQPSCSC